VSYAYGRLDLHRETLLPLILPIKGGVDEHFTWVLRASGQFADARLLPTEQFGLGGYDTVRGYNERVVDGDDGWLLVNEIRTPHIPLGNLTARTDGRDWLQGLIFCDYGRAFDRQPSAVLLESSQAKPCCRRALAFVMRWRTIYVFASITGISWIATMQPRRRMRPHWDRSPGIGSIWAWS
jgi:hypothetical protein